MLAGSKESTGVSQFF